METSRRSVLTAALAGGAGLALVTAPDAAATPLLTQAGPLPANPFTLGVASGDPLPDGVVLWTRLALDPLAGDGLGGMPSRSFQVSWQVARDARFQHVVRAGSATALPGSAHSVHVEVSGLAPGREYWYRFRTGRWLSEPARTLTAPWPGTTPASLAMSFVSCANFEAGWFTAYRRMAEDHPDLVLHLGDYQYEGKGRTGLPREHAGPETMDLATYRLRHAQYKTDPDLQAAHAVAPWLLIWDDHEVDNNYAGLMPEKPAEATTFAERRTAAYRAYYENMPLRRASIPAGPTMQLFRRIQWGELATFHMLDTRQYRDDQACGDGWRTGCTDADLASRSLPGATQEEWLTKGFRESRARWDVIGQQVFFASRDSNSSPAITTVSMDAWDGYSASRERVTKSWLDAKVRNPVVLTGDVHQSWANDLLADYRDPASAVVGSELVCTSITSGGNGTDTETGALAWNPHLKFNNNLRGYVNTTIRPQEMRADFRAVHQVTVKDQPAFTKASFRLQDGERGLQRIA